MNYLGIDPGTKQSGWAIWDGQSLVDCGVEPNKQLCYMLFKDERFTACKIGIEMVGHYGTGMAVGKTTFITCIWIGKFIQQLEWTRLNTPTLILRPSIKAFVCGSPRAKDGNVIQALKDQIGEKGVKANPGPLYGIKSHAWQALALAYAMERCKELKTVNIYE